jgi:hypothetical protein
MQHPFRERKRLAQVHQLEDLARVDFVRLCRCGEDLFEPRQLDVVDIQQLVPTLLDHPIERPRPSAECFHRHHDRQIEPLSHCLDAAEESCEALLLVRNFKLVE